MATKKFLTIEGLTEYDALIKAEIAEGDASVKAYVDTEIAKQASSSHDHDDKYYTETEIDSKLDAVNTSITNITSGTTVVKKAEYATSAGTAETAAEATHAASADTAASATTAATATKATQDGDGKNIAATYETKGDATAKLDAAKAYADGKVAGLASTSSVTSAVSAHNEATDAHADIRATLTEVKEDVDTFFKDATISAAAKDTLKEIQDYITSDVEAAAAMTASINNKAEKEHGHAITEITGLQDALNANSGSITELTEAIEAAKAAASEQDAVVLAEAQNGIAAVQTNLDTYAETVNGAITTAANAISANASAISAHTTSIATLQTEIDNIVEITSQEIQSLFQA